MLQPVYLRLQGRALRRTNRQNEIPMDTERLQLIVVLHSIHDAE